MNNTTTPLTSTIHNTPAPMPDSQPVPRKDALERYIPTVKSKTTLFSDFWFWLTAPRWHLVVLLLDDINQEEKADIPLKEVARFLRATSRFYLKVTYIPFNDKHDYTVDAGTGRCDLYWSVLPAKWLALIQPCSAVLSLYKLYGRDPIHAGSTWALRDGIPIHGKLRPYAAIPTDLWFYNNDPYEGFTSRGGQIATHEIVNTIRGKVEAEPYLCSLFNAMNGLPAWKYEMQRVQLQDECYDRLGKNED